MVSKKSTKALQKHNLFDIKNIGIESWLGKALDTWQNPVFQNASSTTNNYDIQSRDSKHGTCPCSESLLSNVMVNQETVRLNKSDLAHARVIAQVDRKFILIRVTDQLVLVDQHAASERVILEHLFTGMFNKKTSCHHNQVVTSCLSEPLQFRLPIAEKELLKSKISHLLVWGVNLEMIGDEERQDIKNVEDFEIRVSHLPSVIVERCITEPRLVLDLIRAEMYKHFVPDTKIPDACPPSASNKSDNNDWVSKLTFCPQFIIDMVNSRACRSAIMFNDVLTLFECQDLIQKLSGCVFPFICAHGRASMVPIITLPQQNYTTSKCRTFSVTKTPAK